MKNFFALLLIIIFSKSVVFSQKKTSEPVKPKAEETVMQAQPVKDTIPDEVKIYNLAASFTDFDVAKHAMFSLIAKYPSRVDYVDSLARIYYSMNAYPQCLTAADFVLRSQPDNQQMMELSAICQGAMKNDKEALAIYERLFAKTKSIFHLYQVAVLQYSLQRNAECSASVETILADKDAATQKVQISYDEQNAQNVPLSAAAYNLRGVMHKDMKETEKAKVDFEAALKGYPDFKLAKNNLDMMNKPSEYSKEKVKKK
ncbi:MAG: hypothetical protein ABIT08_11950 [Bacteroidia bacterium]